MLLTTPIVLYTCLTSVRQIFRERKIALILSGVFIMSFSPAFFTQPNLYDFYFGSYGRNLGFLTYLFCIFLMLSTIGAYELSRGNVFLIALTILSVIEVVYGLMQYNGKDLVNWNNPFNPIITTFGNPNYASQNFAVIGIVFIILLIQPWLPTSWRIVTAGLILCTVYLLINSNSIQGVVSLLFGVTIFLIHYFYYKKKVYSFMFLIFATSVGCISLLGLLQIGPLKSFLYQSSISARGDYWRAGMRMLRDFPFTGVGIERYGDNFLKYRDLAQAQGRNFNTFADNAHSVPIHMFATGGLFLGTSYLVLLLFGVITSLKILFRSSRISSIGSLPPLVYLTSLPPIFISIDNIGNMVWTWLTLGVVLSASMKNSKS